MKLVDQKYVLVSPAAIHLHPDNARLGDQEAIDVSVEENGFYGACIVQKSTGDILVGNHRFLSALAQKAKKIPVIYVDVDNVRARKIMLADNRTADGAKYDQKKLAKLLEDVQKEQEDGAAALRGTGYDADDVEDLLAKIAKEAETAKDKALRIGNSATITYSLAFDTVDQQNAWYRFMKFVKLTYPGGDTFAAKLDAFYADRVPELAK